MSEITPTADHLNDPYVLQLIEALSKRDDHIEELESYLDEEREKNEKQVRMTMDLRYENEKLRKALADSCDENRLHVLEEGSWSTDMCPIASRLSARIEKLEAENAKLRDIVAVYVDPTGMDRDEHDLVIKCAALNTGDDDE